MGKHCHLLGEPVLIHLQLLIHFFAGSFPLAVSLRRPSCPFFLHNAIAYLSVAAAVNAIFSDGMFHLVVDLTYVSYIDSSGLWALFEGHKKASQKKGHLVLLNPTKDVKRVLDITKVSSKMQVFVDYDEVLSFFKSLN